MGKRGAGRRLTDKERLEIIQYVQENPSIKHSSLAIKYNVTESTVRKLRSAETIERIRKRYTNGSVEFRDKRQRSGNSKTAKFDAEVYQWVMDKRGESDMLPTPKEIMEQARLIATKYDDMTSFKGSAGWYYRFCTRHDLHNRSRAMLAAGKGWDTTPEFLTTYGNNEKLSLTETQHNNTLTSMEKNGTFPTHSNDGTLLSNMNTNTIQIDGQVIGKDIIAPLTSSQRAITHFLEHHKDSLPVTNRLNFMKHLTRHVDDAEMYLVMDGETRLAFIQEFQTNG